MSKRSRSKANILIHRESIFSILSPVFCILYSAFSPSCLCGNQSIMQNKPNFPKPKTNATLFPAKDYENDARPAARKNKPNQTQFPSAIRRFTLHEIRLPRGGDTDPITQRDTQYEIRHPTYEIRDTNPIKPNSPGRYAIRDTDPITQRDTQYEIRHPTYEIRDTNPIKPNSPAPAQIPNPITSPLRMAAGPAGRAPPS